MKGLLGNIVRASVYHVAKEAMKWSTEYEPTKEQEKKEADDEKIKKEMLIASTVHTLLGILYND